MPLNCSVGKTLESSLDCKIKPVNPNGYQAWIFIGTTYAEVEVPIFWQPDAKCQLIGKDWCWERLKAKEEGGRGWDVITDSMDVNLSKLQKIVKDREASCTAVHGVTRSQTRLRDRTDWKSQRRKYTYMYTQIFLSLYLLLLLVCSVNVLRSSSFTLKFS